MTTMLRQIATAVTAMGAGLLFFVSSAHADVPLKAPTVAPSASISSSSIVQRHGETGVQFNVHKEDSRALFDASAQKFKGSTDVVKLRAQVQEIAERKGAVSPATLEQLKLVRKDGNVLRTSFVLFDKTHEAPKKLDAFVTSFGKMNDAIAAHNPEQSAHYARKVLKTLDEKALKGDVASFKPASHKSFEKEMDEQRTHLATSLDKKTVLAPEFHEMRKAVTKVLSIFTLVPGVRKDPALEKLYQKVFAVQTDMGTMHDELSSRAMNGEIDYDKFEVTIPAPMKQTLREILASLK